MNPKRSLFSLNQEHKNGLGVDYNLCHITCCASTWFSNFKLPNNDFGHAITRIRPVDRTGAYCIILRSCRHDNRSFDGPRWRTRAFLARSTPASLYRRLARLNSRRRNALLVSRRFTSAQTLNSHPIIRSSRSQTTCEVQRPCLLVLERNSPLSHWAFAQKAGMARDILNPPTRPSDCHSNAWPSPIAPETLAARKTP